MLRLFPPSPPGQDAAEAVAAAAWVDLVDATDDGEVIFKASATSVDSEGDEA